MNMNKPNEMDPEIRAQYFGVRLLRNEFTSGWTRNGVLLQSGQGDRGKIVEGSGRLFSVRSLTVHGG